MSGSKIKEIKDPVADLFEEATAEEKTPAEEEDLTSRLVSEAEKALEDSTPHITTAKTFDKTSDILKEREDQTTDWSEEDQYVSTPKLIYDAVTTIVNTACDALTLGPVRGSAKIAPSPMSTSASTMSTPVSRDTATPLSESIGLPSTSGKAASAVFKGTHLATLAGADPTGLAVNAVASAANGMVNAAQGSLAFAGKVGRAARLAKEAVEFLLPR